MILALGNDIAVSRALTKTPSLKVSASGKNILVRAEQVSKALEQMVTVAGKDIAFREEQLWKQLTLMREAL
jgi:hypothetical protein